MTPDDPSRLPEEFRPESLGGIGRLPVFSIVVGQLGPDLWVRDDPKHPQRHAFVEPARQMGFSTYQEALCATGPRWKEYR